MLVLMADETDEDIRRVIALCFRGIEKITDLDLERILSFDMEWLSPEEAEQAVSELIDKGWLVGGRNSLSPAFEHRSITTPIGWFPRPSRLTSPSSFKLDDSEPKTVAVKEKSVVFEQPQITSLSVNSATDPREKLSTRLAKYIARQTQISLDEIQRRAEKKQRALNYAANWMCLALIAREQNLEMKEIVKALSG